MSVSCNKNCYGNSIYFGVLIVRRSFPLKMELFQILKNNVNVKDGNIYTSIPGG